MQSIKLSLAAFAATACCSNIVWAEERSRLEIQEEETAVAAAQTRSPGRLQLRRATSAQYQPPLHYSPSPAAQQSTTLSAKPVEAAKPGAAATTRRTARARTSPSTSARRTTRDSPAATTVRPDRSVLTTVKPALDEFPYQAQDFDSNERVFRGKAIHNPDNPTSTWQQWAYDIGASKKQSDGTWLDFDPNIDWDNPKNADYYIYGKPVYAVSDGVVVNCWRNAPENPRPYTGNLDNAYDGMPLAEQTWLHPDTRAGKVHGSGNFIMVREANGNIVHYAHGQPGTVPSNLCPHNGTLLSPNSWDNDSSVPAAQQATIKKGQFLFLTGNVGTSSAPHLHLDRTESDKATSLKLLFRNGLANPLDPDTRKLKNDKWESFSGQQIPPGPVLVWPPRRQGGEWAWARQPADTWGHYFNHMADSGYMIGWIDGYSVNGKPFFNTIWKPATNAWRGFALLTYAGFQTEIDKAKADGLAPVHVDSVAVGGQAYFNAVFLKGASTDFHLHRLQNAANFDATFQSLTAQGYSTVNTAAVSLNGQLRYTSLYRKQDLGGWVLLPGIPKAQYQQTYNENAALGRRPFYVNAFKHGAGVFYSVVFSQKPPGPRKDRHGMTPATLQAEFDSAAGLSFKAVSGVDGAASNHEYIAIWRKDN